jgi:hypothetical protein
MKRIDLELYFFVKRLEYNRLKDEQLLIDLYDWSAE